MLEMMGFLNFRSVVLRSEQMTGNREQVSHRSMDRWEQLGLTNRFESTHSPFPSRFMRKLGSVVRVLTRVMGCTGL